LAERVGGTRLRCDAEFATLSEEAQASYSK
jgi:hypothetical protein